MNEYNTITIEEQDGSTYTERVGWTFNEAADKLLGKEGRNGSIIEQIHMDAPVKIQGYQCGGRRFSSILED
jgi:hypothetical protein